MAAKFTPAGEFRHRINLQSDVGAGRTASGQHVPAWETYTSRWAKIAPLVGQQFFLGQEVAAGTVTHKINMRYDSRVKMQQQILYGNRVFNVVYALNLEERNVELELLCLESVRGSP